MPPYAAVAPDAAGTPNPYGRAMTAFRASLRQLFGHVERLVERLGWDRFLGELRGASARPPRFRRD